MRIAHFEQVTHVVDESCALRRLLEFVSGLDNHARGGRDRTFHPALQDASDGPVDQFFLGVFGSFDVLHHFVHAHSLQVFHLPRQRVDLLPHLVKLLLQLLRQFIRYQQFFFAGRISVCFFRDHCCVDIVVLVVLNSRLDVLDHMHSLDHLLNYRLHLDAVLLADGVGDVFIETHVLLHDFVDVFIHLDAHVFELLSEHVALAGQFVFQLIKFGIVFLEVFFDSFL